MWSGFLGLILISIVLAGSHASAGLPEPVFRFSTSNHVCPAGTQLRYVPVVCIYFPQTEVTDAAWVRSVAEDSDQADEEETCELSVAVRLRLSDVTIEAQNYVNPEGYTARTRAEECPGFPASGVLIPAPRLDSERECRVSEAKSDERYSRTAIREAYGAKPPYRFHSKTPTCQ